VHKMKSRQRLARLATVLLLGSCLMILATAARADIMMGSGEWQSNAGTAIRGTWTVTLERTGADLKGTLALTGSMLFSGAEVTGTLDGDQIKFGSVADGERQLTFSATLTEEKVDGQWSCPELNDSGAWSGTLQLRAVE
jgi:hypothetical protein